MRNPACTLANPVSMFLAFSMFAAAARAAEPAPEKTWQGFHAGAHAGITWFRYQDQGFSMQPSTGDGFRYGALAGFDWQIHRFVLGLEVDGSFGDIGDSDGGFLDPFEIGTTYQGRARFGYGGDRLLPFFALGVTHIKTRADHGGTPSHSVVQNSQDVLDYGAGIDWLVVKSGFVLRLEYIGMQPDEQFYDFFNNSDLHVIDLMQVHTIRFAGVWRF